MQDLLKVITEYKKVALRRDSVGFSGKSLSSSNACRIGSCNSEKHCRMFLYPWSWTWLLKSPFIADSISHAFDRSC